MDGARCSRRPRLLMGRTQPPRHLRPPRALTSCSWKPGGQDPENAMYILASKVLYRGRVVVSSARTSMGSQKERERGAHG